MTKRGERFRLPKEAGHVNEEVLAERLRLGGVLFEVRGIPFEAFRLLEDHPAGDAPLNRSGLVEAEIDAGGGSERMEDLRESPCVFGRLGLRGGQGARRAG